MAGFAVTDASTVTAAIEANLDAVRHSLSACFDRDFSLTVGEAEPLDAATLPDEPGLLVALRLGDEALLLAIPAGVGLPKWYRTPDESESARLQTLAMESALNLVPESCAIDQFITLPVENLAAAVAAAEPASGAQRLPLAINDAEQGLSVCWPVAKIETFFPKPKQAPKPESRPSQADARLAETARARLAKVRVNVSVRLAEKRIEMGQLLSISPGSLVTFNKSCEDLLDLYVNNVLFCRGEAVKIGEKFGLKINEIAPKPQNE